MSEKVVENITIQLEKNTASSGNSVQIWGCMMTVTKAFRDDVRPYTIVGKESDSMPVVEAQQIWKRYGNRVVVRDVSFTVEPGEVLGMVGPNGAGKTTTIRMLLDIIQPDEGTVLLFGRPFSGEHRTLLGYLPEERGLYRDLRVQETLEYLGTLKGMRRSDARRRAGQILERLDMTEHRSKKIAELSRGMGQLIQFAATLIHEPRLLILDEPFSGLDPLNVRLIKDVLGQLREDGVAIILSTHQMIQVEEFCDKVMMINHGQVVLYGALEEVRSGFGEGSILVEAAGIPDNLPGVQKINNYGTYYELVVADDSSSKDVFRALADREVEVRRFQVARLPLEEIFVRIVREE